MESRDYTNLQVCIKVGGLCVSGGCVIWIER